MLVTYHDCADVAYDTKQAAERKVTLQASRDVWSALHTLMFGSAAAHPDSPCVVPFINEEVAHRRIGADEACGAYLSQVTNLAPQR